MLLVRGWSGIDGAGGKSSSLCEVIFRRRARL
jgi:hypothetical protein